MAFPSHDAVHKNNTGRAAKRGDDHKARCRPADDLELVAFSPSGERLTTDLGIFARHDRHSPNTKPESRAFEADVSRLLHLMVHSVYSDRDVFLRELISNAADACEKLRYEAIATARAARRRPEAAHHHRARCRRQDASPSRTTASA